MRRYLAVVLLAVAGCASQPWSPQSDVIVLNREIATPGATAARGASAADLCADVRHEEGLAEGAVGGARFLCAPTAMGAWAVRIDPPADGAVNLEIVVVHAERSGARARQVTPMTGAAKWWPTLAPLARGTTLFDFDGDGEPELFVRVTRIGFEEVGVQQVFLTARDAKISAYAKAPPHDIEAFEDVDGDGLPDARLEAHRYAHARSDGSFWLEKPRETRTARLL